MMKNEKIKCGAFIGSVFLFFLIFYTGIHPILLTDSDDWYNASYLRGAYPIWGLWNPGKVFPETFMALITQVSIHWFKPFFTTLDFFECITFGYAFFMSSVICFLTYWIIKFIEKVGGSFYLSLCIAVFFWICHFWIFRVDTDFNSYMLFTVNTCTLFNYVIPNLLNAALVLWIFCKRDIVTFTNDNILQKSVFWLLCYLCIFSNIWASVILIAFVGTLLIEDLWNQLRSRNNGNVWNGIRNTIINNKGLLMITALWVIDQIFELSGGRAEDFTDNMPYICKLKESLLLFFECMKGINHRFFVCMIILLIFGVIITIQKKRFERIGRIFLSGILQFVYFVLSLSKIAPGYITRPDVFYGVFFYFMIFEIICAAVIFEKLPVIKIFFPILLMIAFFDCDTIGSTYKNSNIFSRSVEEINALNHEILSELESAEKNGESKINIYVPKFDHVDNFPYATYFGDRLSSFAYEYGITSKRLEIQIIPKE